MQSLPSVVFLERQRGCAEDAGIVAEFCPNELHVASPGERMLVDVLRRADEKLRRGLADAAANHDETRVEHVHDADESLAENVTRLREYLACSVVAGEGRLHDVFGGDRSGVTTRERSDAASPGRFCCRAPGRSQRRTAQVCLEVALPSARAREPTDPDDDVPDLTAEATRAAVRLTVEE